MAGNWMDDRERMISFLLSDFAFNTLFHHAHIQQYRFSANDMLQSNSPLQNLLKLNCTMDTRRKVVGAYPLNRQLLPTGLCLGSVFDNATIDFPIGAIGDLVFKSQKPLQVLVRSGPQKSYFGVNGGMIEAYSSADSNGKRELLGRADILSMRGDFMPKMSECNITGSINITDLQLTQSPSSSAQTRVRALANPIMAKLSQLSIPILTEMFNGFLTKFAQFPLPLVEGYECASPEFRWSQRTMQIDCEVRVLPDATRKAKP